MIEVTQITIGVNARFASIVFNSGEVSNLQQKVDVSTAWNIVDYASRQGVKFSNKCHDQSIVFTPVSKEEPLKVLTLEKIASDAFNLVRTSLKLSKLVGDTMQDYVEFRNLAAALKEYATGFGNSYSIDTKI